MTDSIPVVQVGMHILDRFRGREVWVRDLERLGHLLRLEVEGPDGTREVLTLPAAMAAERFAPTTAPAPFGADPNLVRQVAEAHRLAHAYLFDPFFATETSLIHPLPHQYNAVYDHLLQEERLRFLLADDAGAGKTIMAGLYIRHQLLAGALHRVLVVAPAGLVGNWQQELWRFFHLRFEIAEREETLAGNPFADARFDLAVVSLDTAARPRVKALLSAAEVPPYDLVVFDEAHKLTAARDANLVLQATDRTDWPRRWAGVAGTSCYSPPPRTWARTSPTRRCGGSWT